MVAMLTRATCGILSDTHYITDFDLRLLLALMREYEMHTYKFVSCKAIAKNYRLRKNRITAARRVAAGLSRLVAIGVLELGPKIYAHVDRKKDYSSGQKYNTYRFNPGFVLSKPVVKDRRKVYRKQQNRMALSPIEQ